MPKAIFFSKLKEGKRQRGAPRKRYKDQLKRQLTQAGISHQSRQQEASDRDRWRSLERKAVTSRQRGMKPQRKNAGGRKSEQHLYHSHPKPSSVQSAVGCAHQESASTAANERAGTDHRPSRKSSSARNEPSRYVHIICIWNFHCIRLLNTHVCKIDMCVYSEVILSAGDIACCCWILVNMYVSEKHCPVVRVRTEWFVSFHQYTCIYLSI